MLRGGLAGLLLTGIFMGFAAPAGAVPDVPPAEARQFPACTDGQGTVVRYVSTQENIPISPLVFYAGARYLQTNPLAHPAIVYDPEFLAPLTPIERDFTLAHECYHLSSGDALMVYNYIETHHRYLPRAQTEIIERNADCDAARRMRDEYRYSAEDMAVLRNVIRSVTPRPAQQEERMAHIMACFTAPASP